MAGVQLAFAVADAVVSSVMQYVGKQINEDRPEAKR